MNTAQAKPRLVMISHVAPVPSPDNAGQRLVTEQVRVLQERYDVTCLLLPGRSAQDDVGNTISPCHVLPAITPTTRLRKAGSTLRGHILHRLPGLPNWHAAALIKNDPEARRLLHTASVVVLQWQDVAAAGQRLRRFCPAAKQVAVLHDVVSQSQARLASQARTLRARLRTRAAALTASLTERQLCRDCDAIIVLSQKDADLLPMSPRIHVVPASVQVPQSPVRSPAPGRAIMVASWRAEDRQGLDWMLHEVMPLIRGRGITLDVRLIGNYGTDRSVEQQFDEVTVAGFVDDLTAEYSQAAVALVPLWLGAGVKFKVVEALLHRVPLVSTPVGAEGISTLRGSGAVVSTAKDFAEAIAQTVSDPAHAQARADSLRAMAVQEFGAETFRAAMERAIPWH